jgi:hypothetical protein
MERKFRQITGIQEHFPDFVLASGTLDQALKWEKTILLLGEFAREQAETGYDTAPLEDEPALLCWRTFSTLRSMGIPITRNFPSELEPLISDEPDDEDFDAAIENFYSGTILKIFKAFSDLWGFYAAYIVELVNDNDELLEIGMEIESCLMDLAATKIEIDNSNAPNFSRFRSETIKMYEEWLQTVKAVALRSGQPLRAELFDLIDNDHNALGAEAESESLGFNTSRVHPDIYMNELIVGIRAIHQILPAIITKLGISDEELNFDPSELRRAR